MASIAKRPDGRWRARYRDETGRERSRHFARKLDGQRWINEQTAGLVRGDWVDPDAGKVTFAAWFRDWVDRQVWARGTVLAAMQAGESVTFANIPMRTIRPSHVEQWIKAMSKPAASRQAGLAPTTIQTRFNYVNMAFRAAVNDRLIPAAPSAGAKLPRVRKAEHSMMIPTPADVRAALDVAPAWFKPFIGVCAFAGLRLGEAAGLQVGDIDFLRRTLSVSRQVQGATFTTTEVSPPKYGSERAVFIPEALTGMISEKIRDVGVRGDEAWLLTAGDRLLNRNSAGAQWRQVREAAGLSGFTLHDLRHFYASGLIASGCDVVTVQRSLGHSTPTITLNTYSHLWPTAEDRTRAAAAGLMESVLDDPADQVRTSGQP